MHPYVTAHTCVTYLPRPILTHCPSRLLDPLTAPDAVQLFNDQNQRKLDTLRSVLSSLNVEAPDSEVKALLIKCKFDTQAATQAALAKFSQP